MSYQSLVIREAQPTDAKTLMGMIRTLARLGGAEDVLGTSTQELRRAMSGDEPKFAAILAEVDGRAAGFASYTVSYSIWYGECYVSVEDVFIKESMRGSGVGRQLIVAIAELCHEQNCRARWELPAGNSEARAFYESLGVTTTEKSVCYWSKAAMKKVLQTGRGD